ncbi:hypothetical protein TEK04_06360 [Klenkia sp. LSe6-5]|uniref:Uncharacterized protein n=1 Tax=Klenkia sesuvii TaxID=3103137 RepID=A0ABU8DTI4_9ACTN
MTDVRTLLHDLAADAPRGHGEVTADRVVDLHRAQDRRRLRLAGVAAAIAVVVAAVPALVDRSGPQDAAAVASAGTAEAASLFDAPTRGSLADDADAVTSAREASWGEGIPFRDAGDILDPGPQDRHVAFVGEVPGGQVWALVVGRTGPQLAYAWFVRGETGDGFGWRLVTLPERTFAGLPVALVDGAGEHGPLLVVAMPDEDIDLVPFGDASAGLPEIRSSEVSGGIALVDVDTPASGFSLGYEVAGAVDSPRSTFRPVQFDSTDQGSYGDVVGSIITAVTDEDTGAAVQDCLVSGGLLEAADDGGLTWPYLATDEDAVAFLAAVEACRASAGQGD